MKVVVDEGVPRQLVDALRQKGIDAARFPPGQAGTGDGDLLAALEANGFDLLLTNDRNMAGQQNLRGRRIAVVALPLNKRRPILERVDDIADTIRRARAGWHVVMYRDGRRIATRGVQGGEDFQVELSGLRPFDIL